jgi:HipA-like protein
MKSEHANLSALAVRLYGRQIGIITKLAGERQLFSFEQDYIDDPNRPTLSLSFKSTSGGVVTSTRPVSGRVPPFFSNLVVMGNADMHLKNWSLLYPDQRTPVLSPAYDLVSTVPYLPNDTLGLNFGDSRDLHQITKDQVRRFAEAARIPVSPLWKIVTETVERTSESWKTLEHRDALPKGIRSAIEKQILGVTMAVQKQV